jgi:nitrate reductase cytochrome c-type subunit
MASHTEPKARPSDYQFRYLGRGGVMKRFRVFVLMTVVFGTTLRTVKAAPVPDQETHKLKENDKAQRKTLKQQQRAMRDAVNQHPQSPESRRRFEHDMKSQRCLLNSKQRSASRNLKQTRKSAKRHRTSS